MSLVGLIIDLADHRSTGLAVAFSVGTTLDDLLEIYLLQLKCNSKVGCGNETTFHNACSQTSRFQRS